MRPTTAQTEDRFLPRLLAQLSVELGATVFLEPQHGYVGFITFPSGRRWFFRGTSFDVNAQGASAIAKDKDYAAGLLAHFGYSIPESVLLFSPKYKREMQLRNEHIASNLGFADRARAFADKHGFPLFLKPNEASEGRGVTKVYSQEELFETMWWSFQADDRLLLQVPVKGRDFRVVVLDGLVLSAYERRPLHVMGDGKSTIASLLSVTLSNLRSTKRGTKVHFDDPRIAAELKHQGLSMESVIPFGRDVPLLPNANLSTGGESIDLSDDISDFYRDLAISVARDLGLVLAGVDIIAEDITGGGNDYCVLEINSAPGLNNFAGSSHESETRTRKLYRQLLVKMSRM